MQYYNSVAGSQTSQDKAPDSLENYPGKQENSSTNKQQQSKSLQRDAEDAQNM